MKEVIWLTASQHDYDFVYRCKARARDFGIDAIVNFDRTTFSWPINTNHYRMTIEGEPERIAEFKKFIGYGEEESATVPLVILAFVLLFLAGVLVKMTL